MASPNAHKGNYIFHFTDVRNLDSIVKKGLLSTNEKNRLRITHHNIANQTIQARRDQMEVTVGPGGIMTTYLSIFLPSIRCYFLC